MTVVYKLITEEGDYYGHTSDLKVRLSAHRTQSKWRVSNHPYLEYKVLYDGLDEETAKMIEDELIRELPCINRNYGIHTKTDSNVSNRPSNRRYMAKIREGEMMMFGRTNMCLFRGMFK